ncbi:MAG: hypothetical protein J2P17_15850, partial [Mycobacterium sp.]|nr:hypothetical protein [Mycobacterium sp.]
MQPPYLEPFRIKAVEPIHFTTPEQRQEQIRAAGYNLFRIPAEHITIDLLTDSGTGAMSADQWAAMLNADESYAGSQSFTLFRDAVYDLTGYSEVLPVHQGRAAERIIFTELLTPGSISVSNSHFDTTRANVELRGAEAQDLLVDSTSGDPFGGNLDIDKTTELLAGPDGTRVLCIVLTITNNSAGGLAVSVDNVQAARKICDSYHIPL